MQITGSHAICVSGPLRAGRVLMESRKAFNDPRCPFCLQAAHRDNGALIGRNTTTRVIGPRRRQRGPSKTSHHSRVGTAQHWTGSFPTISLDCRWQPISQSECKLKPSTAHYNPFRRGKKKAPLPFRPPNKASPGMLPSYWSATRSHLATHKL